MNYLVFTQRQLGYVQLFSGPGFEEPLGPPKIVHLRQKPLGGPYLLEQSVNFTFEEAFTGHIWARTTVAGKEAMLTDFGFMTVFPADIVTINS